MLKYVIRTLYTIFLSAIILIVFAAGNPEKHKNVSSRKLYKNVINNYLDYKNLSIKTKLGLDFKGKHYKLKASIKITKDSIIWINMTHSTGISVMRMQLTKDSVKYLNKLNNTYFAGNYKKISELVKIDMSYKTIQSIITNELFLVGAHKKKEHKSFFDYHSYKDSSKFVMQNLKPKEIRKYIKKQKGKRSLLQRFFINKTGFKIDSVYLEDLKTSQKLNIKYGNFKEINSKQFPRTINFEAFNDTLLAGVKIKIYKIKIPEKNKYSFKIPSKYKQVNF